MALTNGQKKALHAAARQAGVGDDQRRMIQRNVGGFHSAADPTATRYGYIQVMAVLEELGGGALRGNTAGYWLAEARAARPDDALRFAIRRQGRLLGWSAERLDAFLASGHMSSGACGSVDAAGRYWLHRLLDALKAIRGRHEIPDRRPA